MSPDEFTRCQRVFISFSFCNNIPSLLHTTARAGKTLITTSPPYEKSSPYSFPTEGRQNTRKHTQYISRPWKGNIIESELFNALEQSPTCGCVAAAAHDVWSGVVVLGGGGADWRGLQQVWRLFFFVLVQVWDTRACARVHEVDVHA